MLASRLANMKPLYVIVHGYVVRDAAVLAEILRIEKEEDYRKYNGLSYRIPDDLPKDRKILVCGGFRELCVGVQCEELKRYGYDASIYGKATIDWRSASSSENESQ